MTLKYRILELWTALVRWRPIASASLQHVEAAGVAQSQTQRLDLDQQWSMVESVITAGVVRARSAAAMQLTASRNLDSAHYALSRIAEELTAVMPPVPMATVASVHAFPDAKSASNRQSDAIAA